MFREKFVVQRKRRKRKKRRTRRPEVVTVAGKAHARGSERRWVVVRFHAAFPRLSFSFRLVLVLVL